MSAIDVNSHAPGRFASGHTLSATLGQADRRVFRDNFGRPCFSEQRSCLALSPSFLTPRATICSAPSGSGRCRAFASSRGAHPDFADRLRARGFSATGLPYPGKCPDGALAAGWDLRTTSKGGGFPVARPCPILSRSRYRHRMANGGAEGYRCRHRLHWSVNQPRFTRTISMAGLVARSRSSRRVARTRSIWKTSPRCSMIWGRASIGNWKQDRRSCAARPQLGISAGAPVQKLGGDDPGTQEAHRQASRRVSVTEAEVGRGVAGRYDYGRNRASGETDLPLEIFRGNARIRGTISWKKDLSMDAASAPGPK